MMKTFKITYTKYGNCATYNYEEIVRARSAKMALKKFMNYRELGDRRTREQWWNYDYEVNGVSYSCPVVDEVK